MVIGQLSPIERLDRACAPIRAAYPGHRVPPHLAARIADHGLMTLGRWKPLEPLMIKTP